MDRTRAKLAIHGAVQVLAVKRKNRVKQNSCFFAVILLKYFLAVTAFDAGTITYNQVQNGEHEAGIFFFILQSTWSNDLSQALTRKKRSKSCNSSANF